MSGHDSLVREINETVLRLNTLFNEARIKGLVVEAGISSITVEAVGDESPMVFNDLKVKILKRL